MNKQIICGIYKITSPTGKVYIGKAADIKNRWVKYKSINCKHQTILYRSLVKHGIAAHVFEITEECTVEELNERERYWILFYDTYHTKHGMNLTLGGDGSLGYKHTEEAKRKVSMKNKGRKLSDEERRIKTEFLLEYQRLNGHPCIGLKQSEEHISKRVEKNTGKKRTEETKKLMSQKAIGNTTWVGRHHTEETKAKKRVVNKLVWEEIKKSEWYNSEEQVQRRKNINKGKKLSPERILQLNQANIDAWNKKINSPDFDADEERRIRSERTKKWILEKKIRPEYNTEEAKKQRSEMMKKVWEVMRARGHKVSEETKMKKSIAMKKTLANKKQLLCN